MKEENEIIIRCLNKYGKIPETYKLLEKIDSLEEENQGLKERIEYLERSNNRREDTIMGLRDEIIDQKDYENILNELEKWLKETNRTIDFNYVVVRVKDILEKIHELKESDK